MVGYIVEYSDNHPAFPRPNSAVCVGRIASSDVLISLGENYVKTNGLHEIRRITNGTDTTRIFFEVESIDGEGDDVYGCVDLITVDETYGDMNVNKTLSPLIDDVPPNFNPVKYLISNIDTIMCEGSGIDKGSENRYNCFKIIFRKFNDSVLSQIYAIGIFDGWRAATDYLTDCDLKLLQDNIQYQVDYYHKLNSPPNADRYFSARKFKNDDIEFTVVLVATKMADDSDTDQTYKYKNTPILTFKTESPISIDMDMLYSDMESTKFNVYTHKVPIAEKYTKEELDKMVTEQLNSEEDFKNRYKHIFGNVEIKNV
jgi:hypothetical protein